MEPEEIEQAYDPFVAALRDGGFRRPGPDEGWSAEMIAAHVTLNNDAFTRAAHELVETGTTAYDNETAVDPTTLMRHVEAVGAAEQLADDVQRSARGLAAAYAELRTAGHADDVVPVTIRHEGELVRDRPGPLGEVIEGNATYHLAMHLDQLLALRV